MSWPAGGLTLERNALIDIAGMEDQCWKEVILSADPFRDDGGRKESFGSFWNYQVSTSRLQELED